MLYRLIGIALLLVGIAVLSLGVYGIIVAPQVAEHVAASSQARGFDAEAWANRFRLWDMVASVLGVLTITGGIAVTCRRSWGFVLVAVSAAFAGLFPWLLNAFAATHFSYEVPKLDETYVLAAVTSLALLAFNRTRSQSGT
jgi:hypothetical protein